MVGYRNIDKIKSNIGETVFNHINSLNKSQLEKQLSELKSELKTESKNTERHNKLKDEEWYILYRLERSSEFKYAKGSTVRANKSALLQFANFEDNWHINLVKLNPYKNQDGLLYKGGNKYAAIRTSDKGYQQVFEFKTLEQAENKFNKLVMESKKYSPISKEGKVERNYAKGGGTKSAFDSTKEKMKDKTQQERIDALIEFVSQSNWSSKPITVKDNMVIVFSKMYDLEPIRVASVFNKYQKKYAKGGATKGFEYSIGGL